MPRYEFMCEKCKKPLELLMTISEREKAKPKCPTCKGTKVIPQLGGFMGQTAKNPDLHRLPHRGGDLPDAGRAPEGRAPGQGHRTPVVVGVPVSGRAQ